MLIGPVPPPEIATLGITPYIGGIIWRFPNGPGDKRYHFYAMYGPPFSIVRGSYDLIHGVRIYEEIDVDPSTSSIFDYGDALGGQPTQITYLSGCTAKFTAGSVLNFFSTASLTADATATVNFSGNVQAGGLTTSTGANINVGDWIDFSSGFQWTASTTNPTLGNSTVTAEYQYLNAHTVVYNVFVVCGSTFTAGTGTYAFKLPVTLKATTGVGSFLIVDSGVTVRVGSMIPLSTTTVAGFVNATGAPFGSTTQTWNTGDQVQFTFICHI
jgi:hypothetical protein